MPKLLIVITAGFALSACVHTHSHGERGNSGKATVLICHKDKQTMELPREAAAAHIKHGDRYGRC